LQGLLVIVAVSIVVFFVTRMIHDPVLIMAPIDAPPEEIERISRALGFDKPLINQFGDYVNNVLHGDLGESFWQSRPATEIVKEKLPNTIKLTVAGMAIAIVLAIPFGIIASLRPNSVVDRVTSTTSLIGLSAPQFWVGLLFILLFSVRLGWLPTGGQGGFKNLIMPALTIGLPSGGRLAMLMRSSMIDELNQPWVKVARSKGMPFRRVVGMHALRNASVPVITLGGWEFIRMLSGATVIVESVFAWPGIGLTALQAVQRNDLLLLQAIVLVVATITVVLNIVIDIVYKLVDPRIKLA
jgi:peptide/nickel transport system permease protein